LVAESVWPIGLPVVEHTNAVGAVNGAIPSADTAVIDLDVKTFVIVVGGVDRANRLAGSVFTVLTQDGDESCFNVGKFTFPVTFNTDPLVGTSLLEIILGVDGDVVLCLTSDNTGLTTGTPVQIYYHSPFMFWSFSYH
jgi:hypothetical protein